MDGGWWMLACPCCDHFETYERKFAFFLSKVVHETFRVPFLDIFKFSINLALISFNFSVKHQN